jgi:hypothetical protein
MQEELDVRHMILNVVRHFDLRARIAESLMGLRFPQAPLKDENKKGQCSFGTGMVVN